MRLRTKYTILFMIYLVFFGAVSLYVSQSILNQTINDEVMKWGVALTNQLSDSLTENLLQNRILSVKEAIEDFKKDNPNVVYIYVTNWEGEVVASTFKDGFPVELVGLNPANSQISIKPFSSNGEKIYDVSIPAIKGVGGELHVGISERYVSGIVRDAIKKMVISGIIIAIFGASAIFLSMRAMTKPFSELIAAVDNVIRGNFSYRIKRTSDDEIGHISHAFNRMLSELEEKSREIENVIRQLKHSRDNYKTLVESIEDGVIAVDRDGTIQSLNKAAASLFGLDRKKTIGRKIGDILPQLSGVINFNGRFIKVSHIKTEEGLNVIITRDITEERRKAELDKRLREYERLASVGQLAAELSHGINTPLTSIMLSSELLLMESESEKSKERAEEILEKAELCRNIVSDLLEFTKKGVKVRREKIDLAKLLDRSIEICLSGIEGIRVSRNYQSHVICGDAVSLQLAFNNLLMNAMQAMPEGGDLSITVENEAKGVKIYISDTGEGIPPDILPKIFDPFFTTKENGSGLGLSITRRIIRNHGGEISVVSEVGKGSTFVISLPRDGDEDSCSG